MKKLLTIIAAAFVLSTAAFAKGSYAGDIQLHFGFAADTFTPDNPLAVEKPTSGLFTMDLSTTHLWGANPVVKLGFTIDFDCGLGGTFSNSNGSSGLNQLAVKANMLIGPCIGFTLGNVVRFDVAPALSVLFCDFFTSYDANAGKLTLIGAQAVGPAIEVKAKFAPKSVFSPVIGYRFSANFTSTLISGTYNANENSAGGTTVPVNAFTIFTNSVYVGFGWNW